MSATAWSSSFWPVPYLCYRYALAQKRHTEHRDKGMPASTHRLRREGHAGEQAVMGTEAVLKMVKLCAGATRGAGLTCGRQPPHSGLGRSGGT